MTYRKEIVGKLFSNLLRGSHVSADGMLKVTIKESVTICSRDKILAMFENPEIQALDVDFEKLVEWEPKLNVSKWRELSPEMQNELSWLATVKDAAPTLELNGAANE